VGVLVAFAEPSFAPPAFLGGGRPFLGIRAGGDLPLSRHPEEF